MVYLFVWPNYYLSNLMDRLARGFFEKLPTISRAGL